MSQTEKLHGLRKGLRQPPDAPRVRLIVREDGGARFDFEVLPDGQRETVVIAQVRGEASSEAARRAMARIASIERSGRKIESAVVLVAPFREAERSAARALMTRALLSHMASNRQGELLLSVEEADAGVHQELSELAEALGREYREAGVDVCLRIRAVGSSPLAAEPPAAPSESDGRAA